MTELRFNRILFLCIFLSIQQNAMYAMKSDENGKRFDTPKILTKHYDKPVIGGKKFLKKETKTDNLRDRLNYRFLTELPTYNMPQINTIDLLPEMPTPVFNENNLFFNDHVSTAHNYYPLHDDCFLT